DSVAEEIWIPAWKFLLTRKSSVAGASDDSISFGDLEIFDALTLRGAGSTPVQAIQTIAEYQDYDPVFDLLGDFSGDGIVSDDGAVNGDDYLTWLTQSGFSGADYGADADDDGDVDAADLALWSAGFGEALSLTNVS
ncbi:MAG: hypothetical protein IT424_15605, partial [Pirellulales bacterium]|nr:hypothetical protein [Pirellulales bacterium]